MTWLIPILAIIGLIVAIGLFLFLSLRNRRFDFQDDEVLEAIPEYWVSLSYIMENMSMQISSRHVSKRLKGFRHDKIRKTLRSLKEQGLIEHRSECSHAPLIIDQYRRPAAKKAGKKHPVFA